MLKILVPTDFSEYSKHALDFALSLAERQPAEILIVHATFNPVQDHVFDPSDVGIYQTTLGKTMIEHLEEKMSDFIYGHEDMVSTILESGQISSIINQYINDEGYNLVVIGSRGITPLEEFMIGSTTEKVIRAANCPVFSIHKNIRAKEIKNIAFASDFKSVPKDLIHKLKDLQALFKAHLHFIKINTPTHFESDRIVQERANEFLQLNDFTNSTFHIYNDFTVDSGIIHFARHLEADLIALGTHGYQGIRHLFSGSVAENVANHTWIAVWTYKPSKEIEPTSLTSIGQTLDISYS